MTESLLLEGKGYTLTQGNLQSSPPRNPSGPRLLHLPLRHFPRNLVSTLDSYPIAGRRARAHARAHGPRGFSARARQGYYESRHTRRCLAFVVTIMPFIYIEMPGPRRPNHVIRLHPRPRPNVQVHMYLYTNSSRATKPQHYFEDCSVYDGYRELHGSKRATIVVGVASFLAKELALQMLDELTLGVRGQFGWGIQIPVEACLFFGRL